MAVKSSIFSSTKRKPSGSRSTKGNWNSSIRAGQPNQVETGSYLEYADGAKLDKDQPVLMARWGGCVLITAHKAEPDEGPCRRIRPEITHLCHSRGVKSATESPGTAWVIHSIDGDKQPITALGVSMLRDSRCLQNACLIGPSTCVP